jgi:hypothetical protein
MPRNVPPKTGPDRVLANFKTDQLGARVRGNKKLAYVYFEMNRDGAQRPSCSRNEARRIAANVAKLITRQPNLRPASAVASYQIYFAASAIKTAATITNAANCTQRLLVKPR